MMLADFLRWLMPLWLKRWLRSVPEWDAYYLGLAREIQGSEPGGVIEVENIHDIERAKRRFSAGIDLYCAHRNLSYERIGWWAFGRVRLFCSDCTQEFDFVRYWSMVIYRDTLKRLGGTAANDLDR